MDPEHVFYIGTSVPAVAAALVLARTQAPAGRAWSVSQFRVLLALGFGVWVPLLVYLLWRIISDPYTSALWPGARAFLATAPTWAFACMATAWVLAHRFPRTAAWLPLAGWLILQFGVWPLLSWDLPGSFGVSFGEEMHGWLRVQTAIASACAWSYARRAPG